MKTASDPRHIRRQRLVQDLFKKEFHTQPTTLEAKEIFAQKDQLDAIIKKIAPEFEIEKINKVDLAILRLAIFELTIRKSEPPHVIVDEAIELAKEFSGESSPAFVNGALGNLLKHEEYTNISK
jgi:N utilization substance protein B